MTRSRSVPCPECNAPTGGHRPGCPYSGLKMPGDHPPSRFEVRAWQAFWGVCLWSLLLIIALGIWSVNA